MHRNAFIDIAETVRRNLRLDRTVTDAERAMLLERLADLESKADARRTKRAPDPGANPAEPERELEGEVPVEG